MSSFSFKFKSLFFIGVLFVSTLHSEAARYHLSGLPSLSRSEKKAYSTESQSNPVVDQIRTQTVSKQVLVEKKKPFAFQKIRLPLKTLIELKDGTEESREIYLGDLLSYYPAFLMPYKKELGQISIGTFKKRQTELVLSKSAILEAVSSRKSTRNNLPDIEESSLPGSVRIVRYHSLLRELLVEKSRKDLAKRFNVSPEFFRVNVQKLKLHVVFHKFDSLNSKFEIVGDQILKGRRGNFLFQVLLKDRYGEVLERSFLTAQLKIEAKAYLANRLYRRGEDLTLKELQAEWIILPSSGVPIFKGENFSGYRVRNSLRAGHPVLKNQLELTPLAEGGATVQLILKTGSIRVLSKGILMEKAFRGKNVRVKNKETHRILIGRVVDSKSVEVEL